MVRALQGSCHTDAWEATPHGHGHGKGARHCEAGGVQGLRKQGGLSGASQPAALLPQILHEKPMITPHPAPLVLLASASPAAPDSHLPCSLTSGTSPGSLLPAGPLLALMRGGQHLLH